MENSSENPKNQLKIVFETSIRLISAVIGIAFILATLFTAWTPGSSSPEFIPIPAMERITTPEARITLIPTNESVPPTAKIGIVAGHWGNDSGAVCADNFREVDINLDVASIVQKMLTEKGFQVDLLGEFDPKLAGYNAAALVSIHADSCDYVNELATGFKVAASMANPHPERSVRLTSCIRNRYYQSTGMPVHSLSVTPDMTSYHAFGEIGENTTAAIIEIGFLNLDREFLTNNTDKVASGIVDGILCYLNNENIDPTQEQGQP